MRRGVQRLGCIGFFLVWLALAACSAGGALFTEEELDAMYSISVSMGGATVSAGSRVSASSPLKISATGMNGAPEAAVLEVELTHPDGTKLATLAFSSPGTVVPEARSVKNFEHDVPPFTIPEDLPDGYYTLTARIKNAQGAILSKYSTALLVYTGEPPVSRIAVYPGTVTKGEVSLLILEGGFDKGLDPWIRWSMDGSSRSSGFLSDHADRLAWQAPQTSGVYLAKAEIFPFQPPAGFDVAPLAKAEIRLPISGGPLHPDPLASRTSWSRLTFDIGSQDQGSRPRSAEPTLIGLPYLDTYSSGFGLVLGEGSGIASTSSLVPARASDGRLEPFTLVLTIASPQDDSGPASGSLLAVSGYSGDAGFTVGVQKGVPYLQSGTATVSSALQLPAGPSRLAVYVEPLKDACSVYFYLNEQAAGGGQLDAALFNSRPGACVVAGPGGYVAIYDEMRVLSGPYPAFLLSESERGARGSRLLAASGFEGSSLGQGFELAGTETRLSHGRLELGQGSRLLIGPEGQPATGSTLSFRLLEGRVSASLKLESGVMLVIGSDGSVRLDEQDTNLRIGLEAAADRRLTVSVEKTKEGLRVYGSSVAPGAAPGNSPDYDKADTSILINGTGIAPEARWIIAPTGTSNAALTDVSLSVFSAPIATAGKGKSAPAGTSVPDSSSTTDSVPSKGTNPAAQAGNPAERSVAALDL